MSQLQTRPTYNIDERECIQRALRRYMRENRISVQALCDRIVKADLRHREISRSTLRRIIAGSHHRTTDENFALCHAFVKDLPYYGEDAELLALGTAMSGFLLESAGGSGTAPKPQTIAPESGGKFETFLKGPEPKPWTGQREDNKSPHALIEFTPIPGKPFLRVSETEFLGRQRQPDAVRYQYEGVLIVQDQLIFLLLKSTLTQLPKVYWLEKLPPEEGSALPRFRGQMTEGQFRGNPTVDGGYAVHSLVHLEHAREEVHH